MLVCLDLIQDQRCKCSCAFQYPGQLLEIWDCPEDSGTVGTYDFYMGNFYMGMQSDMNLER